MIYDGIILMNNKEYKLAKKDSLQVGSTVADLDEDTMTVFNVDGVIKDTVNVPDGLRLSSLDYSKDWEHHIWINL